jgi:hypothetical protein
MDTFLLKYSPLTENSHIDGFATIYCNYMGKAFVTNRQWNQISRERHAVSLNEKFLTHLLEASLDYRNL